MTELRRDILAWLAAHVVAILLFTALTALVGVAFGIDLETGWGSVFRRELLMASGSWGSWLFLSRAHTVIGRRVARFTTLVPGLAMLLMTVRAYALDYSPDRWNQWLLAGLLALSLAWHPRAPRSDVVVRPWRIVIATTAAVACWVAWLGGATSVGDPTLGLWWGAPIVAVATSTWLPRVATR